MRKFSVFVHGVLLGALLAITPALAAQQGTPAAQRDSRPGSGKGVGGDMERRMQNLTTRLNLMEDQQKRIRPILEAESTKIETMRDEPGLSRVQRRAKLREIRDAVFAEIQPILTPEQQKKHDELHKQAQERKPKRR